MNEENKKISGALVRGIINGVEIPTDEPSERVVVTPPGKLAFSDSYKDL